MSRSVKFFAKTFVFLILIWRVSGATVQAYDLKNQDDTLNANIQWLSNEISQLNNAVSFSVSNVQLSDFLRALAESANLNMHIESGLNELITYRFEKEKAGNILRFLCTEFDLEIQTTGTIISVKRKLKKPVKSLQPNSVRYDPKFNLLSVSVNSDSLTSILESINGLSDNNVIIDKSLSAELISVDFQKLEFPLALEAIAISNKLQLRKLDKGFYLFEPLEQQYSNQQTTNTYSQKTRNISYNQVSVNQDELGQVFVSANLNAIPLDQVLDEVSELTDYDYVIYNSSPMPISMKVKEMEHDRFLEMILNKQFSFSKNGSTYLIGKTDNRLLKETGMIRLQNRSIEEIVDKIPERLKEEVELLQLKELNAILVHGTQSQVAMIESFINSIDQVIPMIQIEVLVVDYKKGRDINTGIGAGLSDSVQTAGTFLPGLDLTLNSQSLNQAFGVLNDRGIVNIGKVNPNFYASLKAMEQNDLIDIRSTPKLATLNAHEANLTIGKTEFYLEQTQNIQGANTIVTTVTPQYREISADLSITILPMVSEASQVTLDVNVEFADFTTPLIVNGPPGKSRRKFTSKVRVKNEEVIVLGGLEQESKARSSSGFPILSRIPVLNWLLGGKSKNKNQSKLMIFIKPIILYE